MTDATQIALMLKVLGGRKRVEIVAPAVRRHLERMLDETTAGNPMSPLKWTSKSTYRLAAELTRLGPASETRSNIGCSRSSA
jgi:hypothetical protein